MKPSIFSTSITMSRSKPDAANLRGVNKDQHNIIPPALLDRRRIVYTMDIEKLGIPKVNKYELAAFIDNLDISEKEKSRLKREALIEFTPFEIIPNDPE